MRVGSLVYATDQGLGILAKSFFDAGVVTDVMIIAHGRRLEHPEWYPPGTRRIGDVRSQLMDRESIEWINSMDAMLFFETPFEWALLQKCRELHVKTALMPMHECMPQPLPAVPDLFIHPSQLDERWGQQYANVPGVYIPVPVDDSIPFRRRKRALTFVHNAGHGGLKGRNGTREFVEAAKHVKSDARLIVRAQENNSGYWAAGKMQEAEKAPTPSNRLEVRIGTVPYEELWRDYDVFVFPEKFNGLSLPLQEARAAGMLVMATDRFPMNLWLPRSSLIPTVREVEGRVSPRCSPFQEAIVEPKDLARVIDEWYGRDISAYSESALEWREQNSWSVLKDRYLEALSK